MDVQKLFDMAVSNVENSKPRNHQKAIGPSALGGCKRRVWLQLQDAPKTNETERLPSWMGTAIHEVIAEGIKMDDPFGDRYLIEHRVEREGMFGSVDFFDPETGAVVDWKTIKKSGARYFPKEQQRWQVQVYGWMLAGQGHDVQTVSLVGIPRDGTSSDVVIHTEPYDETVALEALEWLEGVKGLEEAPDPEMPAKTFCAAYCDYFGACPGR
jgi:hypothetical protein